MSKGTLNKVTLIGNLGTDPEIKHFEGGGSLSRFPIATSESYTNRNGEAVEITEWHTIVLRGGMVEVSEKYLKKGDKIYVEGRIRTRSWQDAQGEKRYTSEIQADNMIMLGGNRTSSAPDSSASSASTHSGPSQQPTASRVEEPNYQQNEGDSEDDLPF